MICRRPRAGLFNPEDRHEGVHFVRDLFRRSGLDRLRQELQVRRRLQVREAVPLLRGLPRQVNTKTLILTMLICVGGGGVLGAIIGYVLGAVLR